MMFTNTNRMIYAVAMECYKAVIIWYKQFVYHVNKIFNDNHKKPPDRS
jgi:hypothetical protein